MRDFESQIEWGERCSACGDYIFSVEAPGHPRECPLCDGRTESGEAVTSEHCIRCPNCGNHYEVQGDEHDYRSLCAEGVHQVTCAGCGYKFEVEVETRVTYSFTSPERLTSDEEDTDHEGFRRDLGRVIEEDKELLKRLAEND